MYRKALIDLLRENPIEVAELARSYGISEREMAGEIEHLRQSFRNEPYRLVVFPARCRKCDFVFDRDHLTKPGKCPDCRGTWIQAPRIKVEAT